MEERKKGVVKWFDSKKGFGVVISDDSEYFIHHSQINVSKNVRSALYENENVEFDISLDDSKDKKSAYFLSGVNGDKLTCEKYMSDDNRRFDRLERGDRKLHRPKNTENFNPTDKPASMRVVNSTYDNSNLNLTTRDVVLTPADLFCKEDDLTIYNSLLKEMEKIPKSENLWKLWHGDTHHIADDHLNWKKDCPTFNKILDTIQNHFNMNIKATRFNWYKNPSEWKPFHFDAAAVDPVKSKTQNFTVGVSFGAERDIAFQIASHQREKDRAVISFPLKNGQGYAFCKDLNTIWRHGVPQLKIQQECGRISIVAWGWVDQTELY
jgi:cold shock CspA family protein